MTMSDELQAGTEAQQPQDDTPRGSMQINGKSATAVRYEMLWGVTEDELSRVSMTFVLGRKTVARMVFDDSTKIDQAIGERNHETMVRLAEAGEDKGTLRNETLIFHTGTGEEITSAPRRARAAQNVKADVRSESNVVEPDVIDAREAVARADRHRQNERAARDATEGTRKPTDRSSAENGSTSQPAIASDRTPEESEARRRAAVLDEVHGQFRVTSDQLQHVVKQVTGRQAERLTSDLYRFKDGAQGIAFRDTGTKLATSTNDARAARAVAAMADGKGWASIKVSGHGDFRREVWIEAAARGLEVRGYSPTEQDREEALKRSSERLANSIEEQVTPKAERARTTVESTTSKGRAAAPASKETRKETSTPEPGAAVAHSTEPVAAPAPARRPDPIRGTLLEHGPAPYEHDPSNNPSYHVKLATPRGEREFWGVDLAEKMAESGATAGDKVQLQRQGAKPVTVEGPVRDEDGQVVGRTSIASRRREWDVQVTERRAVLDAVTDAFTERHASTPEARQALREGFARSLAVREQEGRLPEVPMYDRTAPSRSPVRSIGPAEREQTAERTR